MPGRRVALIDAKARAALVLRKLRMASVTAVTRTIAVARKLRQAVVTAAVRTVIALPGVLLFGNWDEFEWDLVDWG